MKFLISCILLVALSSFAANPPYQAFKGSGGITITTNPPNGDVMIDGSLIVGSTNAPASSTSAGRGMSNLVWSRVLHVDSLFGTNATAIRGDASKPFRDPHWAVSNAVAGDTVFLRPGRYDVGSNHLRLPHGVSLVGSGPGNTFLVGTGELLTAGCLIAPGSTSYVANLAPYMLQPGNTYHGLIGAVDGINLAFTNAIVENVFGVTDTDGIYVTVTTPCSARVFNSYLDSRWDCVVIGGNSNHFFEFFNVSAKANNFQVGVINTANAGQSATCLRNLSGTVEWHGGTLIATNGEFDGTFTVIPDNSGVHTNFTRLYGVRLVAAGTNDTARIFVVNPATHGFVYEHAGEPIFTQPTAGAYQALYNDGVISVTNAVSRTITLPDIAPLARDVWTGLRLTIHDKSQLASTTNIFITASGNQRINGTIVTTNISTTGGIMELLVIGTNWYVVNLGSLGGGSGTPAGANGDVQYNNAGAFGAESAFNYDAGDNTLSVTSLLAQSIGLLANPTAGHVLTSDAFGTGTWQAPASAGTQMVAAAIGTLTVTNTATIGSGNGILGFSTNHFMEGVPTLSPSVLRTPTNANSGVMVALPVAGITNQQVAVTLTAGQVLTHNGTNYLPGPLSASITDTNNPTVVVDWLLGWNNYIVDGGGATNISVWMTNTYAATPGRSISVEFATNMVSFALQVTNLSAKAIKYSPNVTTNGYPTFVKTNTTHFSLVLTMPTTNYAIADAAFYR